MCIDQATITMAGPWITAVKDVLVGLAAAAAAIFAYLGLSAWRKELKGKSEYELAKRVLMSVYRVREAFKTVRHPAIYQYEYPEEMRDFHGHLKREHEYEGTLHVYGKRLEKMDESFKALEEQHLEAQVEWGPQYQDVIVKLRRCRSELVLAIQQLLRRAKNPREEPTKAAELAEERSVLYHIGGDPEQDRFTSQIDEAITDFEKWLRPHIRTKG